jgi:peptide/nickel transport system ATP-binding protein
MGSIPVVGTKLERLTQIEGAMPRLSDIPPGCAFHPRCPSAMPACARIRPEPRAVADGRVACLLYEGADA